MDKKPISPTPFPTREGGERLHHVQLLLSPPWKEGLGGAKRDANKVRYPLTRRFTHRYTKKNCQDSPTRGGVGGEVLFNFVYQFINLTPNIP